MLLKRHCLLKLKVQCSKLPHKLLFIIAISVKKDDLYYINNSIQVKF